MGLGGLTRALASVLGNSTFDDLKTPFSCTAVDVKTCKEVILCQGRLVESLLASAAVPGVFPAREIGDDLLIDGGVVDPVPVGLARRLAPTLPVVAVVLSPPPEAWSEHSTGFQIPTTTPIPGPIIEQLARMRLGQAFSLFVQSVDISGRVLTELRLQIDQPEVIIRPDVADYSILGPVDPSELVTLGKIAGDDAISEIRKAASWSGRFFRRFRSSPPPLSIHVERCMP